MTIKGNVDQMIDAASFKARIPHLSRLARYITAGSPWIPSNVLSALAYDALDQIRLRVAENPRTSAAVLVQLAFDANQEVRLAAVENANAPNVLVEILARDANDEVRFGVAENYKASADILTMLAKDRNPYVACRAEKTLRRILATREQVS
jgi:hypothetical protein